MIEALGVAGVRLAMLAKIAGDSARRHPKVTAIGQMGRKER